ncbi:MAG: Gfo/Idh/MocA family oxidoreductase [Clostridiales bacterium]|nr:Gfo/Idh/MocA family oxidoreductase [Clostridiales bacterium]
MAEMLRMGVIGVGGIARGVHIPGIQGSKDAELTAVCDIKPEVRQFAREKYGLDDAHVFEDYNKLLACPDVDAVSICTPNNVHVEIALAAVATGKPFACEKPLSLNAAQAKPLIDALAAKPVANMICFSYRFKAAARYARDLIREGKIGTIRHVYAQYMQGWANPVNDCPKIWRFDKGISGSGTLADLGSHMLDLVRWITGDEYREISAQNGTFVFDRRSVDPDKNGIREPVDVDDYSHTLALTEGGIAATFEITRNGFARGNYQRVEIYGDLGGLVYELEDTDVISGCFGAEGSRTRKFERLEIPEKYRVSQIQSFFNRVKGLCDNDAATVEDGYRNMLLLDKIIESSDTGRRLCL